MIVVLFLAFSVVMTLMGLNFSQICVACIFMIVAHFFGFMSGMDK